MNWTDYVAIIISTIALLLSIFQFFVERRINRQESTINAFSELQKEVLNKEKYYKADVNSILENHKKLKENETDEEWEQVSEFLARIEQFAVGVNTNVYSIKIVDRMAGSHLVKQYDRFKPIINYKREKSGTNKRYEEFEKMKDKLKTYNPNI